MTDEQTPSLSDVLAEIRESRAGVDERMSRLADLLVPKKEPEMEPKPGIKTTEFAVLVGSAAMIIAKGVIEGQLDAELIKWWMATAVGYMGVRGGTKVATSIAAAKKNGVV